MCYVSVFLSSASNTASATIGTFPGLRTLEQVSRPPPFKYTICHSRVSLVKTAENYEAKIVHMYSVILKNSWCWYRNDLHIYILSCFRLDSLIVIDINIYLWSPCESRVVSLWERFYRYMWKILKYYNVFICRSYSYPLK